MEGASRRTAPNQLSAARLHASARPGLALLAALFLFPGRLSALHLVEDPSSTGVLTVLDGTTTVLCYRFGDQLREGVDPKYTRSCYIHPLYSLDGQPLTDDFPKDHLHHRGVFWTWPVVEARGQKSQTWMPHDPPLRQRFVRWLKRGIEQNAAVFSSENAWVLGDKEKIARERVTVHVYPVVRNSRAIDVDLELEAVGGPLKLQGTPEGKKGYGGFCLRTAPLLKGVDLMTSDGQRMKDVVNERHPWVDLSNESGGVAIFVPPDHPDFPPPWLVRSSYTGFLNPEWPGLPSVELKPGEPRRLSYRIYIHRGNAETGRVREAYEAYRCASTVEGARKPGR
jgi:hypothetical protein